MTEQFRYSPLVSVMSTTHRNFVVLTVYSNKTFEPLFKERLEYRSYTDLNTRLRQFWEKIEQCYGERPD